MSGSSDSLSGAEQRFVRLEVGGARVDRSVAQVRNLIAEGRVPAVRIGQKLLVDLGALERYYAARPVAPREPGGAA
jgi:hypothetical protein